MKSGNAQAANASGDYGWPPAPVNILEYALEEFTYLRPVTAVPRGTSKAAKKQATMHAAGGTRGPSWIAPIEGEQFGQELIIAQRHRSTVGGEDGGGEFLVGEVEPGGAMIVEIGEGQFFELLGAVFVFGDEARVADGADSFPLFLWKRAWVSCAKCSRRKNRLRRCPALRFQSGTMTHFEMPIIDWS